MRAKVLKLKEKEKEFVSNYILLGCNGTKAYMATYPNAKYATARVSSTRLLAKPSILEAIQKRLDDAWGEKDKKISRIFNDLYTIATSDISEFIDDNGDIKVTELKKLNAVPIQQYDRTVTDTKEGQNVKTSIKFADKIKAIQELNKIFGIIQEKVEHSGTIEVVPAVRPDKKEEEEETE